MTVADRRAGRRAGGQISGTDLARRVQQLKREGLSYKTISERLDCGRWAIRAALRNSSPTRPEPRR